MATPLPAIRTVFALLLLLASCAKPAAESTALSEHRDGPAPPHSATPAAVSKPHVLLVGDSTLLAVEAYELADKFTGFVPLLDVASCRTLGVPSCGPEPAPTNAVDAIEAAVGDFDAVVVMAGYDEWWTSFPQSVVAVVDAALATGAGAVIWLNYRVGTIDPEVGPMAINDSYTRNNGALLDVASSGRFPELTIADWNTHSRTSDSWLEADEIHLTRAGATEIARYISDHVANALSLPCPELAQSSDAPTAAVCTRPT